MSEDETEAFNREMDNIMAWIRSLPSDDELHAEVTRLRARVAELEARVVAQANEWRVACNEYGARVRLTLDQVATEAAADKADLAEAREMVKRAAQLSPETSNRFIYALGAEARAFLERTTMPDTKMAPKGQSF